MRSPSSPQLNTFQGTPQFREITVLTRAVEKLFRKLIRMLIGRISLKKLQEMIQIIFVEESEAKLKKVSPEKNVSLADLALLTGVDTRTIKKTRLYIADGNPIYKNENFLDGYMPMFKIFNIWMNDDRFFDQEAAKPKDLKLEGEDGSFAHLVSLAMQSRGLTQQVILKRLKEIGVIKVNEKNGTVKLSQEDNIFISKDELDSLEVGFTAIGSLADTVNHNIISNLSGEPKFYQRGCWDFQFNPEHMDQVRKKVNAFLREKDNEARALIGSLSDHETRPDQMTAGISMFYFEEEPQH